MTLDELLAGYKAKYGDAWRLEALERFLFLNSLSRCKAHLRPDEIQKHLLLKKWVEDVMATGVRATEGQ